MVSEEFLKNDIKWRIKNDFESKEFLEGFMHACYLLGTITKKTLDELKVYLKEKGKEK